DRGEQIYYLCLARSNLQQLFPSASNHDWRVGLLYRSRIVIRLVNREEPSVIGWLFLGPHRLDQTNGIVQLVEAFDIGRIRISMCVVFGTLPSRTHPEQQPSF